MPIALPTDLDVIRTALATCWKNNPDEVRAAIIPNTSRLETLWVSPTLVAEVDHDPGLVRETELLPAPFLSDVSLDLGVLFPRDLASSPPNSEKATTSTKVHPFVRRPS